MRTAALDRRSAPRVGPSIGRAVVMALTGPCRAHPRRLHVWIRRGFPDPWITVLANGLTPDAAEPIAALDRLLHWHSLTLPPVPALARRAASGLKQSTRTPRSDYCVTSRRCTTLQASPLPAVIPPVATLLRPVAPARTAPSSLCETAGSTLFAPDARLTPRLTGEES